jgi:hypothetical protein
MIERFGPGKVEKLDKDSLDRFLVEEREKLRKEIENLREGATRREANFEEIARLRAARRLQNTG